MPRWSEKVCWTTTTPADKAMFQMMRVFAEFERSMIREWVNAGIARAQRTASIAVARSSTPSWKGASVTLWLHLVAQGSAQDRQAVRRRHGHGTADRGGVMTAILAR